MGEGASGLEPEILNPGWFQAELDRRRLEILSLPEASAFATAALVRGFDGPALRELAWSQDGWREAHPLPERARAEVALAAQVVAVRAEAARLVGRPGPGGMPPALGGGARLP